MKLKRLIKQKLEDSFKVQFDIESKSEPSLEKYFITLHDAEQDCFFINVEIKDDTRLTVFSEPEKYGANFLSLMNGSSKEKREIFINFWDEIINKNNKVSVRINDQNYDKKLFISDESEWKKFNIRFTKSPFYEEDNRNETVVLFVTLVCSMMLSLVDYKIEGYEEGNLVEVTSKRYERNPINRELCLYAKGYTCVCCGFNFKKAYGRIGEGFIEVHHLIPVSKMGPNYLVDPVNELVPICSNCHSMVHKKMPPYTIDEIKQMMREKYDSD